MRLLWPIFVLGGTGFFLGLSLLALLPLFVIVPLAFVAAFTQRCFASALYRLNSCRKADLGFGFFLNRSADHFGAPRLLGDASSPCCWILWILVVSPEQTYGMGRIWGWF